MNCKDNAVCQEWGLHRFRKPFATNPLVKKTIKSGSLSDFQSTQLSPRLVFIRGDFLN